MDTTIGTNPASTISDSEYEIINLEKTKKACGLCEKYSSSKAAENDVIAVMSCEGACLRGEISRRAANQICFEEMKENSARICLGGAFTKDTGQRNLVRSAKRVIALEGCFIECASRMMKGVIPGLKAEVILVDKYYDFDKNLFAINEVTEEELAAFSKQAVERIMQIIKK